MRSAPRDPVSMACWVTGALLAASALVFVVLAIFARPDSPVEAELGYEALRVARGVPLYVDPAVGAFDQGPPASRFYVLYTPIVPWIVGHLASPSLPAVRLVGRILCIVAWLALLVVPVATARRENRALTAIGAMFAGGIYFLARFAPALNPDPLAALLVCVALARAAKKDALDPLSAALLVAAPLVKPSCLGALAGAGLAHLALRRAGFAKAIAGGIFGFLALATFCHVTSDGAWLSHIVRSTGQPVTLTRWLQEFGSRCFVLGLPHVAVAYVAFRRKASWFSIAPLLGSVAWVTFAMAKHGSGTRYWLEPTGAALVALAQMPRGEDARGARPFALAGLALGLAIGATSLPGYLQEARVWATHRERVTLVDRHCVRAPDDVVVSNDVVLEIALNGRMLVPDWQTAFLARSGRFPADAWRTDLRDPHVRWLALSFDLGAPLGSTNDERVEVSAFRDVLRPVVDEHFVLDRVVAGTYLHRRVR